MRFILRARELGFTIEELKGLLELVDGDGVSCGAAYGMAQSHIASIRSKIADLRKLQKTLSETSLQCARGDTPECPIIDALYGRD